jgi:hypothetical protein
LTVLADEKLTAFLELESAIRVSFAKEAYELRPLRERVQFF